MSVIEDFEIYKKVKNNEKIIKLKLIKYINCYGIYFDDFTNEYYFSKIDKNFNPQKLYLINIEDISLILLDILTNGKVNWKLILKEKD